MQTTGTAEWSVALRQLKTSMTYAQIGGLFGFSRQRAQQIVAVTAPPAKGKTCAICGASDGKMDTHHDDYVANITRVLCSSCHRKLRHSLNGSQSSNLPKIAHAHDWSAVDWNLSNAEIAARLGCTTGTASRNRRQRGLSVPRAKLSLPEVEFIRSSSLTPKVLAEKFGVSVQNISLIRSHQIWR